MVRLLLTVVAVSVGAAAFLYTANAGPSPPSPNRPRNASPPYLQLNGPADDEVELTPQPGAWTQRVSAPLRFTYSWLRCDLAGKHCTPLAGLQTKSIAPPQQSEIVTLRGVVTATNRFGSTSATTSNFFYDMAGYPFDEREKDWMDNHLQFGPDQLRAWYGLGPDENGAGQTIVITAPWRVSPALHAAVAHFSSHYGLPRPCPSRSGPQCFKLSVLGRGRRPRHLDDREVDLDVEWAHAIAPAATIDVLQAPAPESWIPFIARRTGAHVFSSSWSLYPHTSRDQALAAFVQLDRGCNVAHIVCTWSSGDEGQPGRPPANSPAVLAVGGTLFRSTAAGTTGPEEAWRYSGGGTTRLPQPRPAWQWRLRCDPLNGDCHNREIPDVGATAEAVPQYDAGQTWHVGGGTSLAAPLWAALIALADQKLAEDGQPAIGIGELHRMLYRGHLSAGLDDLGKRGWDVQTGWGSPRHGIVDVLTRAVEDYRRDH